MKRTFAACAIVAMGILLIGLCSQVPELEGLPMATLSAVIGGGAGLLVAHIYGKRP